MNKVPMFNFWLTGKVGIMLLLPVVAGAFLRKSVVAFVYLFVGLAAEGTSG